jgi:hypothetical protein
MKRDIKAAIQVDKRKLNAKVGNSIVAELAKGGVKKVFRHPKGWYGKVAEMQARPCLQAMEHQTDEQEELYAERAAHGRAFLATGCPTPLATIKQLKAHYGLWFPC